MGEAPKTIERRAMDELGAAVSALLLFRPGHEIKADTFVALRPERPDADPTACDAWLPVQVKATCQRSPVWCRKIRHVLNTEKTALHGCVLLGFSLRVQDKCFVLLVHKCRDYTGFEVDAPSCNYARKDIATALVDIIEGGEATLLQNPTRSLVYSQETLTEHDARRDFKKVLQGSQLRHEPPAGEYGPVDGYLRTVGEGEPERSPVRVQEKVCQWRWSRGKTLCLRAKITRSNGRPYTLNDADFLLLHARAPDADPQNSFRAVGAALIPFDILAKEGYLWESDEEPGRGILSLFPDIRGVQTPRKGVFEEYFYDRADVPDAFSRIIIGDEPAATDGPKLKCQRTEEDEKCSIQ